MRLNYREKRALVRSAHSWRWSDSLIASRLDVNSIVVQRIRQELNLPPIPQEDVVTTLDKAA